MVARVRRVPRRALHFDRAWRLGLQPCLAVLRRCRGQNPASPLAQRAYHVKYGRATSAEWVGALHPGGVLRPGVGAASASERGPFRTPRVAPGKLTARAFPSAPCPWPVDGATPAWSSATPSPSSRASEPSAATGARRRWPSGSHDRWTATVRADRDGVGKVERSGDSLQRRHEARGVRAGGGRCECLRQSCAAHYAGRCGRLLTAGWHAHPVRAPSEGGSRRTRPL